MPMFDLFTSTELASSPLESKGHTCETGGLYRTCKRPKMPPSGDGGKGVLVVAEAPGALEDARGTQLVGECGQLLRRVLDNLDIDLDRDCWKTNACACRPPSNETPLPKQILACRPKVFEAIKARKPKVVILLGNTAVQSVIGAEYTEDSDYSIGRWRGYAIPSPMCNAWIVPSFHPSYILRNEKMKEDKWGKSDMKRTDVAEVILEQDLRLAFEMAEKPLPEDLGVDFASRVHLLSTVEAVAILGSVTDKDDIMVAFDYETTGIKPHRKGHKIVCCSLCWEDKAAYSFMLQGEVVPALKKFLKSSTKKVAANMQYEDTWSRTILGVQVNNWFFDTMLASHLIENRKGVCSLKFQAYANFGMGCYTESVGLLKGERNDPNSFNGIEHIPEDSLLLYNGLDSLFEYKLAKKQLGIIRRWEQ